jgi:dihydrolipoamide dehydrogenase
VVLHIYILYTATSKDYTGSLSLQYNTNKRRKMMRRTFLSWAKKFDVCVIGGGPAGIAAAVRAYEVGKKACIIEEARIGGADFWNGALQSKTLWEMAKFARYSKGQVSQRFMKTVHDFPAIKHENLVKAIDRAAETREAQVLELMKNSEIELINGTGAFKTPNAVAVSKKDGSEEIVEADYFVIATGAQPRPHPTAIADGKVVFTSDDIMYQPLPKSIVIIGAGVIGCEFASIFANFGETKVNVIEKTNRILPMEDEDISLFVQTLLEQKGVCFHHHSSMESNSIKDGKFHYTLRDVRDNSLHEHVTDSALVSIGRVPNVGKLNLQGLGVKVYNNRVERDDFLRIKPFKHIYACGDACTRVALVNVGELEGRACIEHMYIPLPEEQLKLQLDNLSTIMFLDQEVAAVGLNEQQCKKAKIGYKMARYSYEYVGRALAMGNTSGFIKLVVTNDKKMQVLGVRAVGPHASSIIELASLAIHNKESAYNLRNLRTAYPAVTQGFQECLHMLLGSSILKPGVFPKLVIQEWSPANFEHGRAYAENK